MQAEQAVNYEQESGRYHPRVDANFMLKVIANGRSIVVKASDLSMNGVFIAGHFDILPQRLILSIPIPKERDLVTGATVVRHLRNGIAVEFDELDWDDLIVLARYLSPRL